MGVIYFTALYWLTFKSHCFQIVSVVCLTVLVLFPELKVYDAETYGTFKIPKSLPECCLAAEI